MPYSQKYTIVQFFEPTEVGQEFSMDEWPLHITLADVFAIDRSPELELALQQFVDAHSYVTTKATENTTLGTTDVTLLERTPELQTYHDKLVEILEAHGAVFNEPGYVHAGFLPHVTTQAEDSIQPGDNVIVNAFSLVDMFPDGDWQRRKVLRQFYPIRP